MEPRELFALLREHADPEVGAQMSAYMRGKFPFLGVPSPVRKALCREFFRTARRAGAVDWAFVDDCWQAEHREFQYVAADYLFVVRTRLADGDLRRIARLATTKSWWDTVDALDRTVGSIVAAHPAARDTMLTWSVDDDLWLRRIAIDHQLLRKDQTDTALLEEIIVANLGQQEFFINKAIGWALRDYSKTDPGWVRAFIERHRDGLAPLSVREAGKYL